MMPTTRRQCNVIGSLFGIAMTPLAVMLFDRREPVTLEFTPEFCKQHFEDPEQCKGKIVPYYVRPTQRVAITWSVIENRACEGAYTRRIRENADEPGGKVHAFDSQPTTYSEILTSDRRRFSKEFVIPKAITPGPAVYYTVGRRWCNIMQRMFWPIPFKSPEIPFFVLDEAPSPAAKGERGEPGDQGIRGDRGVRGDRGERGLTGDRGSIGPD